MKKFRWDKKYLYWGVTAFIVIVASIVFYLSLAKFSQIGSAISKLITILSPFIWGLVISYLLCPLTNILERNVFVPLFVNRGKKTEEKKVKALKSAKGLSVFLSMMALLALIAAFIWLVAPQVVLSLQSIVLSSSDYVNSIYAWIERLFADYPELSAMLGVSVENISESVLTWIEGFLPQLTGLLSNVTNGVLTVVKGIYNILIGMIASVYVLYNRQAFGAYMKKLVYCVFSVEASEKILLGVGFADRVFNGFLSGKILDSAIIGILCYVGCSILKIPYAMLVSVIVGITNVIPFFGPFIGAIPSILIIFMVSPLHALIFLIFVVLLQQFDGNFLGPKILGNSVGVNGFWIMFSIIVGSGFFGFMGMLLGVPVFVLIYSLISVVVNRKLKRSGLPTDNEVYLNISHIDPRSGDIVERNFDEERETKKEFRNSKGDGKKNAWNRFVELKRRDKGEEKNEAPAEENKE